MKKAKKSFFTLRFLSLIAHPYWLYLLVCLEYPFVSVCEKLHIKFILTIIVNLILGIKEQFGRCFCIQKSTLYLYQLSAIGSDWNIDLFLNYTIIALEVFFSCVGYRIDLSYSSIFCLSFTL